MNILHVFFFFYQPLPLLEDLFFRMEFFIQIVHRFQYLYNSTYELYFIIIIIDEVFFNIIIGFYIFIGVYLDHLYIIIFYFLVKKKNHAK